MNGRLKDGWLPLVRCPAELTKTPRANFYPVSSGYLAGRNSGSFSEKYRSETGGIL